MKIKNINSPIPWRDIIIGLKAKPAYLLIFSLCLLFVTFGGIGSVITSYYSDYYKFTLCIILLIVSLIIAYLTIRTVENTPEVKRERDHDKLIRELKSIYPMEPLNTDNFKKAIQILLQKDTRYGNFNIGLRVKDPTRKMPMIHKTIGLLGEAERMANIMASFIKMTVIEEKLKFNKIVIPKSGNILFSIKAGEKTGYPIVGFRGRDFAIADNTSLNIEENYFDGILLPNDRVIIIDDITFRGDTIKETIGYLKTAQVKTIAVFVLLAHQQYIENIKNVLWEQYGKVRFFPILVI